MPLAELNRVVLFAHEYSLIQPRLLADEFLPDFVGRALAFLPVSVDGKGGQKKIQLVPSRRSGARIFSAGLSLVQFRELLGNRRINELFLRFRVGSLTFCSGTFSSVPFVKK
jgi:hypothetical protein